MAIAANNIITKADVVNYFNTNVVNVAFSGINWHSGAVPTYTASVTAGTQWSSWEDGNGAANNQYKLTGGQAVPSSQLSSSASTQMTTGNITDTVITASSLVAKMRELATNCSRIRYTTCRWYHDTAGTNNLVQTYTGKAIYLANTPAISGTTKPYYTKSPNTTAMTVASSAAVGELTASTIAKASSITTFVSNLVSEWQTRYNTAVTFTYYTCHSVCHSSCYHRARR